MPDTANPPRLDTAKEQFVPPVDTARPPANPQAAGNARRKRLLGLVAAAAVIGAVGWGAYYGLYASHFVSTDNAYVGTDTAQVNALVAGPVSSIRVNETQTVKAGDVLMTIDDSDAKIAVEQAQAALALAQRQVQGLSLIHI